MEQRALHLASATCTAKRALIKSQRLILGGLQQAFEGAVWEGGTSRAKGSHALKMHTLVKLAWLQMEMPQLLYEKQPLLNWNKNSIQNFHVPLS